MVEAPAPDFNNIQGDIWPGLSKKYQIFWFFRITDADAFKPSLLKLVDDKVITTSADALANREDIQKFKATQPKGTLHELAAVNLAFSFKGMQKLSDDIDGFRDDPFRKGMEGDMVDEGRDILDQWMDEFKAENGGIDGVILICGTHSKVNATTKELAKNYFSSEQGIERVAILDGRERPEENAKHEHFGFLDAISQPRLKGFDKECEKGDKNYQFMCRPGRIIVGHDGDMNNEPASQHPPWAKDGSYLVVRRLKQFVPEFNSYLEREAPKLNFTEGQLGARLVGRWKSGAPVQLHPNEDCPEAARMNDFDYPTDDHTRCPFASHMRKTKPRGIVSNRDMNDIMRRGIPYGPEVGINETKTEQDRGLMFTCYQSSIGNGFQFLKRSWVNLNTFPADKTKFTGGANPGQDIIIGQRVKPVLKKSQLSLTTALVDGKGQHTTTSFEPFIESKGGDYFFSPSLSYIAKLGGREESTCCCGTPEVWHGKLNYGHYATNENMWAVFPKGRKDGAPLYVFLTFTKDAAGREKREETNLYGAVKLTSCGFTTKGIEQNSEHYYQYEGSWSCGGKTLNISMFNPKGNFLAKVEMAQK